MVRRVDCFARLLTRGSCFCLLLNWTHTVSSGIGAFRIIIYLFATWFILAKLAFVVLSFLLLFVFGKFFSNFYLLKPTSDCVLHFYSCVVLVIVFHFFEEVVTVHKLSV